MQFLSISLEIFRYHFLYAFAFINYPYAAREYSDESFEGLVSAIEDTSSGFPCIQDNFGKLFYESRIYLP